jgi:hypothetical protein
MCDADTSFTNEQIQCNHITVVGSSNHAIGDFYVLDTSCPVHSSWFKHADNFFTCGSRDLYIDASNHFSDAVITLNITVANAIIHGTNRLPVTYGTNGRITISNCVILGNNIFNHTDKVTFNYMEFKDDWFTNPGSVDFYNNVMVRTNASNRLLLSNFQNETAYVNAIGADGQSRLDMAGRRMSSFTCPASVTEIYNLVCTNSIGINKGSTGAIVLNNVKCTNNVSIISQYLTIENGCDLRFLNEPSVTACWANDSTLTAGSTFTTNQQYIFKNCTVNISFNRVTDNTSIDGWLEFNGCTIGQNYSIRAKTLNMIGCTTNNNVIKVYPYKGSDNQYHLYCNFRNNIFNNSEAIEFTKIDIINGSYDEDCAECILDWSIINNTFNDSDGGLRCRYWQNRVGSRYNVTFVKWGLNLHNIKYYGNVGSCPAETPYGASLWNNAGCESHFYWFDTGNEKYVTLNKSWGESTRTMLKFDNTKPYHWDSESVGGNGMGVVFRTIGSNIDSYGTQEFHFSQGCWVYPYSHLNSVTDNGDLFRVGFSKWGKVQEGPTNNIWKWRFLAVPGDFSSEEQT